MRKTFVLLLCVAACGDGNPPLPQSKRPAGAVTEGGGSGGGRGPAKPTTGPTLVLKPKVDAAYRKEFSPADFTSDLTGEINRDPFRSYLVQPVVQPGTGVPMQDECADHKVAEKYSYNDLRLLGIIMRGTKNFAMFRDPTGFGQVAYQGDCLSKEKAKIIEITPGCVRIQMQGQAPPGAPAPPPHEDKKCLHPNDIQIE
jgi:hypothetical protein